MADLSPRKRTDRLFALMAVIPLKFQRTSKRSFVSKAKSSDAGGWFKALRLVGLTMAALRDGQTVGLMACPVSDTRSMLHLGCMPTAKANVIDQWMP